MFFFEKPFFEKSKKRVFYHPGWWKLILVFFYKFLLVRKTKILKKIFFGFILAVVIFFYIGYIAKLMCWFLENIILYMKKISGFQFLNFQSLMFFFRKKIFENSKKTSFLLPGLMKTYSCIFSINLHCVEKDRFWKKFVLDFLFWKKSNY